jgi:hypothetical protein
MTEVVETASTRPSVKFPVPQTKQNNPIRWNLKPFNHKLDFYH